MSSPYLGEIRMFAGNFAPVNWMFCDGQSLPIDQYTALYQLLVRTYGGDSFHFQLPDLRGRVPIHQDLNSGLNLGATGGFEQVALTVQQLPMHTHSLFASTMRGNSHIPTDKVTSDSRPVRLYVQDVPMASLNAAVVTSTGGSRSHNNVQPYLCIHFIIALIGLDPTPT